MSAADRRTARPRLERLEGRTAPTVVPVGGEFRVNSYTTNHQTNAAVALDGDGDFVVAWQDGPSGTGDGQDGSSWGIYAQRYNALGVPLGPEFRVNTTTTNAQINPAVSADAAGDFVVAWSQSGGPYDLGY